MRAKAAQTDEAKVDTSHQVLYLMRPLKKQKHAKYYGIFLFDGGQRTKKCLCMIGSSSMEDLAPRRRTERQWKTVWRPKACTYWSWIYGNRIFFLKFPPEWRNDLRNGSDLGC